MTHARVLAFLIPTLLVGLSASSGFVIGRASADRPPARTMIAVATHAQGNDLRYLCQGNCGSIDDNDTRYGCQGNCGSIRDNDARYACQDNCGSIQDNDLRYFCQGNCGSI